MNFLKELFGTVDLSGILDYFTKIAGNQYALYDYLFLVLGVYLLQRIFRGRATFLIIIAMAIFVSVFHHFADMELSKAVMKAYAAKGIAFFRQEIFLGVLVLFWIFSNRHEDGDVDEQMLPIFVMIESVNIIFAVGDKTVSDQWPFWGIGIFMFFYMSMVSQAETDYKIEQKILNGDADEKDQAYWLKRKREKEREADDYYLYDQNHS